MAHGYTLFIDESGEAGIARVRDAEQPGASPYMTMGAVIVPNAHLDSLSECLESVKKTIGKQELHCSNLKHFELLFFAKSMAKEKVRFFGAISKKKTLGPYKTAIKDNPRKYYNKCAQYLLERVGWFMGNRSLMPHQLDIVFERANVDYDALANLIRRCQDSPLHESTKQLRNISADRIYSIEKNEHPALCIADLVAHALYKCVDKTERNFGIVEPRYLRELSPRFFGNPETAKALGAGLYCVHSVRDLELEDEAAQLFHSMTPE
ncbi:DUF3800 domain-containing protein [Oceanicaulis alexandrii]|uniref:DUF3800 domain-containing protein n=1 Tax=Oceanicaulis alexandrii TaxID=153233 RepID=UPI0023528549|nr:DUF3800 domain-containing protein [Oceanicaulis alexandrii]